ncbi:hypothetical protein DFH09DRAFT_1355091 [Mycena vulgaris]|nr:hypothetical protein DFH09DRAFT_1355091 [Mycena vulgaris]
MLINLLAILTILVLGQGAVSAPQTPSCAKANDPPCPAPQRCCKLILNPDISFCHGPGICPPEGIIPT